MSDRRFDPKDPGSHGRFISDDLGILMGEASHQKTSDSIRPPVTEQSDLLPGGPTYYDQPLLKKPVWIWSVPVYFYVGGTAGAALTLAAAAQSVDRYAMRGLIGNCRWIGVLGISAGSALLIWDLGYKRRFLNMLRVFRPTSPLNVGTWLLMSGGSLSGTAALFTNASGFLRTAGDLAGRAAGLVGMPLAGYTGVVLADTAVPAWQEARRMLPVLFIGSAMAGTASLLELLDLKPNEEAVARRFGIVGKSAELAATVMMEREACRVERVARPFQRGFSGTLWKIAKTLSAASLLLSVLPGKSKRRHQVAGVLGSLGALTIRFAVFEVGRQSGRDPRATFEMQRAGHGAAEVTGTPASPADEAVSGATL
jgi:formate-dependent nitrite reductase membrane component NrfD